MMKPWLWICILAGLFLTLAWPGVALADSPTPAPATVTITVLGVDDAPLPGVALKLELIRYADSMEYLPGGECMTDSYGQCVFVLADAPRTHSGYAEALLEIEEYGTISVGWTGDRAEITIKAADIRLEVTVSAPLDAPYEGQTEQAPDPRPESRITPPETPQPTKTAPPVPPTPIPTQPTPTATATVNAPRPSTATPIPDEAEITWLSGAILVGVSGLAIVLVVALMWVLLRSKRA